MQSTCWPFANVFELFFPPPLPHVRRSQCQSHQRPGCEAKPFSFFRPEGPDAASSTVTFRASMTRDISPPEAISCRGFNGSPAFCGNQALNLIPTMRGPIFRRLFRRHLNMKAACSWRDR